MGYNTEVSECLTQLCTYNGFLPQGASSSPYLSNLVCLELDKKIHSFILDKGITYTRYADDLTFSSNDDLTDYILEIKNVITEKDFKINEKKMRLQKDSIRQIVTGLVVNSKVNVPRQYYRSLKQEIYYCKKYGVYSHMKKKKILYSNYKYHLYGKALYIRMINPEKGEKLISDLNSLDWQY